MVTNYPALNINQFDLAPVQGQLDLLGPTTVITGQVDAGQATALVAGQAVKMATTNGGVPKFVALTANTDKAFGFVCRNIKDVNDPTYSNFELAINDSIMWMTAGGVITRGANVEVVYTTNKVIASAGVNPVVGIALDGAPNGNGDLIRVIIKSPTITGTTAAVQTVDVVATLAQINAGLVLIPGQTGQKITVLNYIGRVVGTFATGTGVFLESNNGTPVVVSTILTADIAGSGLIGPTSTNTTLGAGWGAALGSGDGLQVIKDGATALTGGTSIEFTITYKQA